VLTHNDLIPGDKIDPIPIASGSRVFVHRLRGQNGLDGRVLRVPRDLTRDPVEVVQMELLKMGSLSHFLPAPETVRAEIGGQVRRLVSSMEITSPLCRQEPSAGAFSCELQGQASLEQGLSYLRQMRGFIDACKKSYWDRHMLPDLVGKGNVVTDKNGVWLLDFNNISGEWAVSEEVRVPLDDQGLPIFDMGLSFMHSVEKKLLSCRGSNFSTESFNQTYHREREVHGVDLPEELQGVLVSADALKRDPFYGALRFQARREKVNTILDLKYRERVSH
jgi:hypothetical protein